MISILRKKTATHILILALGNPGSEYEGSPHNAGFEVADAIIERAKEEERLLRRDDRKEYALAELSTEAGSVCVVKPLLFMNHSGSALKKVLERVDVAHDHLWVVHDELDLPLGELRISFGSRPAGHNGVSDIIERLGTKDFFRFRIGVRPPRLREASMKGAASTYLTTPLRGEEGEMLADAIEDCANLIEQSVRAGTPAVRH